MNRKAFFASLSALLVTITGKLFGQTTVITPCRPKIRWGSQIPLCNGQCPNPECDYRADSFPQETHPATITFRPDYAPLTYYQSWYYAGPTENHAFAITGPRLNRCPNCNTAFWQDPELVFRTEPKQ